MPFMATVFTAARAVGDRAAAVLPQVPPEERRAAITAAVVLVFLLGVRVGVAVLLARRSPERHTVQEASYSPQNSRLVALEYQ